MSKKLGFTLSEVLITLAIIGVVSAVSMPILTGKVQSGKVGPMLKKFATNLTEANMMMMERYDSNTILDSFEYSIEDYENGADNDSKRATNQKNEQALSEAYILRLLPFIKGNAVTDSSGNLLTLPKVSVTGDIRNYQSSSTHCAAESGATGNGDCYNMKVVHLQDGTDFAVVIATWGLQRSGANINKSSYKGSVGIVYFDINGFKTGPNLTGKDVFVFTLDDTGVLVPFGGQEAYIQGGNLGPVTGSNNVLYWPKSCQNGKTPGANSQSCTGAIADNGWKVMYKY